MAENGETEAVEQQEEQSPEVKSEPMETDITRTEDYQKLIDYGINEKVASELDKIYQSGK